MIQRSAADRIEHTLTPDMPVTTAGRNHLERTNSFRHFFCESTVFQFAEGGNSQYLPAYCLRTGDLQRSIGRWIVGQWCQRQYRSDRRRLVHL